MKKRKQMLCVLLAGLWVFSTAAQAEVMEDNPYFMEPEGSYQMDLDGDETMDLIRFETAEQDSEEIPRARLDIYRNGRKLCSLLGDEGTYSWGVSHCPLENGKNYLLAFSRGDNDWTSEAILLSQENENNLTLTKGLCELSRKEEEPGTSFLSPWARLAWAPMESVGEDTFTLRWAETVNVSGIVSVAMEYRMTEEGLVAVEPPYALLEQEKDWTAYQDFTTVKEPDSEEKAFDVKKGEVVKLIAIDSVDGVFYLECVNEAGERGWIQDTETTEYHAEDDTYGYFEESHFAG